MIEVKVIQWFCISFAVSVQGFSAYIWTLRSASVNGLECSWELLRTSEVPGIFLWGENHGALGGIAGMQERFLKAGQDSSDARRVELLQNSQDGWW